MNVMNVPTGVADGVFIMAQFHGFGGCDWFADVIAGDDQAP